MGMPAITEISRRTASESAQRTQFKRTWQQTMEHINELCASGDCSHETAQELVASFNEKLKRQRLGTAQTGS